VAKKPLPKGAATAKPKPARRPKPATPKKAPAAPTAPAPAAPAAPAVNALQKFKEDYLARAAARRAPREAKIKELKGKRTKARLKAGGLAALATLGAGFTANKVMRGMGATEDQLMRDAAFDLQEQFRQSQLSGLVQTAKEQAYQDAIQRNLGRIQQYAPDLYLQVAAGRKLPTGAVVLGGNPRTDLLQELGRSMADGRYSG